MFIEGFRTDSLYLGNVRISQLLAVGCVIFGIMFYHLLRKKAKPVLAAEQDAQDYESLFTEKSAKKSKKSGSAKKEVIKAESETVEAVSTASSGTEMNETENKTEES
jgi:phosphatidylglycerol:prolipoprotein diacylglycerol transferase